jgi:hypothetical protein
LKTFCYFKKEEENIGKTMKETVLMLLLFTMASLASCTGPCAPETECFGHGGWNPTTQTRGGPRNQRKGGPENFVL